MVQLPSHLTWKQLCCIVEHLGYKPAKHKKRGSARDFVNTDRDPAVVTFHEPHGNQTIPRGTMALYINKLRLTKESFAQLLEQCH
jgi:predicted RNA binding protein YcfA (HicA-like mRNA interferase family)